MRRLSPRGGIRPGGRDQEQGDSKAPGVIWGRGEMADAFVRHHFVTRGNDCGPVQTTPGSDQTFRERARSSLGKRIRLKEEREDKRV